MKKNKSPLKTKITITASAIGFILFGTNHAFSAINANNTEIHAPSGTVIDTGSVGNRPAVTISNNGSFIADGDLTISTKGQNSHGISIATSGGTAIVNSGNFTINTQAFNSNGVLVSNGGTANLSNGKIFTQGYTGNALKATGSGSITVTDTEIQTSGYQAHGAYANGSPNVFLSPNIKLDTVAISTTGNASSGVMVDNGAKAEVINTTLNTQGDNSNGVLVKDNLSNAVLEQTSITTTGKYSHAINTNLGGTVSSNNSDLSTSGDVAMGIYSTAGSNSKFSNGKITTLGKNSDGAHVIAGSSLEINHAEIITQGLISGGVRANNSNVNIDNSRVSTAGDGSYGLDANANSTINAKNVVINTSGAMEPTGNTSSAVVAEFGGKINLTGESEINTSGSNAFGLLSQVRGSNLTDTIINAGDGVNTLAINTTGESSFGVIACSLHGDGLNCSDTLVDNIGTGDIEESSKAYININKANISTTGQNSYGIYSISSDSKVTGESVDINTQGDSAHGIVILRGGEVDLVNSNILANGQNSAGAYITGGELNGSTASISLKDSTLQSKQSDGVFINSSKGIISLDNSYLSGSKTALVTTENSDTIVNSKNGSVINGNIDASGRLSANFMQSKLYGDVTSNIGNTIYDAVSINATDNSTLTGSMTNVSSVSLKNSEWNITKSSTIDGLSSSETGGLKLSNSHINFINNEGEYKKLTASSLSGNGSFTMNTELNEGDLNTKTDQLHITGSSSGDYNLLINNTGGLGKQTVNDGIKIAQLDGDSTQTTVKLGKNLTAGAYEYLLYQGGSIDENNWYLRSQLSNPEPVEPGQPGPVQPEPAPTSYNPSTIGYVIGPYITRMYGFDTVGTLHERVGDQENIRKNEKSTQGVWGRISGGDTKSNSGRFNYDAQTWFAQFGGDLYQTYNDSGARTHAGLIATIGQVSTDAKDNLRSIYQNRSVKTGSINSKGYGVGAYLTHYTPDSSYLDTVIQYTHYNNEYKSIYGDDANQNGNGITLSMEVGKPYKNKNGWFIEPQAQIIYQYLHLSAINDGISNASKINDNSGLGRLGARIGYDSVATSNAHPYLTADVISVIGGSPNSKVSNTEINQDYSNHWGQVGGGITGDITKNTSIYADIKYKKSFDGDMHGYTGNFGVRVNW